MRSDCDDATAKKQEVSRDERERKSKISAPGRLPNLSSGPKVVDVVMVEEKDGELQHNIT